jgi:hypothetical protein
MRAICLIRDQPAYRKEAFWAGLQCLGYRVMDRAVGPFGPDDVAVIWNRYGCGDALATAVEAAGGRVVVCENGYLGREWRGGFWYAMALDQHNGAGRWFPEGPHRWASIAEDLAPFRLMSARVLVLPQRGIGAAGVAMPGAWLDQMRPGGDVYAQARVAGLNMVIRDHPGDGAASSLDEAFDGVGLTLTWASGAALKGLVSGIPVSSWFDRWIARDAGGVGIDGMIHPVRSDVARRRVFESLAWAMWEVEEIAHGVPFRHLLLR